jgi:hypothetical protein
MRRKYADNPKERVCKHCGTTFTRRVAPSGYKESLCIFHRRIYCSNACNRQSDANRQRLARAAREQKDRKNQPQIHRDPYFGRPPTKVRLRCMSVEIPVSDWEIAQTAKVKRYGREER